MTETRALRPPIGADLTPLQWDFLNDAIPADDPRRSDLALKWRFYEMNTNRKAGDIEARPCADLWRLYGPMVLELWIKEHPGTRPSCWWRFEGPDGPDAMASCVPPVRVQPAKLKRLGALTKADEGWAVMGSRPERPPAKRASVSRLNRALRRLDQP